MIGICKLATVIYLSFSGVLVLATDFFLMCDDLYGLRVGPAETRLTVYRRLRVKSRFLKIPEFKFSKSIFRIKNLSFLFTIFDILEVSFQRATF